MWTLITNCARQLTIHSKIRENSENYAAVYEIAEVEFDKYNLRLLERNNVAPLEKVEVKLNCAQLIQYAFEVEEK
ncbi:MAG TPA: hypothetical protein VN726_00460 [Hanamia sp.]|nr:hypothetical protein [Hanamia sp.]